MVGSLSATCLVVENVCPVGPGGWWLGLWPADGAGQAATDEDLRFATSLSVDYPLTA